MPPEVCVRVIMLSRPSSSQEPLQSQYSINKSIDNCTVLTPNPVWLSFVTSLAEGGLVGKEIPYTGRFGRHQLRQFVSRSSFGYRLLVWGCVCRDTLQFFSRKFTSFWLLRVLSGKACRVEPRLCLGTCFSFSLVIWGQSCLDIQLLLLCSLLQERGAGCEVAAFPLRTGLGSPDRVFQPPRTLGESHPPTMPPVMNVLSSVSSHKLTSCLP